MTDEITKIDNSITFTNEQVELIKKTISPEATDLELKLFLNQAKRTGLDPLTRQIYFQKRKFKNKQTGEWESKVSIQTSIDGFRVVAERSGDYAGQDEPEFVYEDKKLVCAKVKVYKWHGDTKYLAATGVAFMAEYKPVEEQAFMWNKMPHTMLAKVAEALALRKAFPQDLSGLYTNEEMEQVDKPEAEPLREVPNKQEEKPFVSDQDVAKPGELRTPRCVTCGVEITEKVAEYSLDKYNKTLCYLCQKKVGGK